MGSERTRKLLDVNENVDQDVPESSMQARTRPRLQTEQLGFGIQLPPSQPPVNTDEDSNQETKLAMYFYIHQPEQPPQLPPPPLQPPVVNRDQDSNRETELTLYFYVQESPPEQSQPPPQTPPPQPAQPQQVVARASARAAPRRNSRRRHERRQGISSSTIEPPFPWATDRRAQVHSLKHLTENGIKTISGDVKCKRCKKIYQIDYDLEEKFKEVSEYVANNKHTLKDRAPFHWMTPVLPKCNFCDEENSVKPVMKKKKSVNWLFLLLGQMLGCCKLVHLKYFCKHTGNHRTGAKDRVLFLTYLGLCKQVNPDGPFDRD